MCIETLTELKNKPKQLHSLNKLKYDQSIVKMLSTH